VPPVPFPAPDASSPPEVAAPDSSNSQISRSVVDGEAVSCGVHAPPLQFWQMNHCVRNEFVDIVASDPAIAVNVFPAAPRSETLNVALELPAATPTSSVLPAVTLDANALLSVVPLVVA